jgi:hypothetical protein
LGPPSGRCPADRNDVGVVLEPAVVATWEPCAMFPWAVPDVFPASAVVKLDVGRLLVLHALLMVVLSLMVPAA